MLFANNIFTEKCFLQRAFGGDRFRNGSGKSETLIAGVLTPGGIALESFTVDGEEAVGFVAGGSAVGTNAVDDDSERLGFSRPRRRACRRSQQSG